MTHVQLPFTPDWLHWPQAWVWTLLFAVLLPLLWLLWLLPGRRPVVVFSSLAVIRAAGSHWRRHLRLILPILRTVALVCLIVAVARPQVANESRRVMVEGIAIQMVVDTSSSMKDPDLSGRNQRRTRLDVVKEVFRRFVVGDDDLGGRKDDLVGMIRFARYADSVCPLTLDQESLLSTLDTVEIVKDQQEDGTAIGNALAFAVHRMKDLKRTTGSGQQITIKSRVIILLTDGEDNLADIQRHYGPDKSVVSITPEEAGDLAATYGIKVYTIMAGTGQAMAFGMRRPVDDSALRHIADVTGGKHFRAENPVALKEIYAEIDELERTEAEEHSFVEWGELAWPWMMAAFVCLCVQTMLDATVLRKIP